ncbi:MAG: ROK family protein [Clostridiales bacterium]|nr:ROK family protein [Clostridiales bacterium]
MYRIGVDLGGTNIVSAVVDDNCKILAKGSRKTNAGRPAEDIFDDIAMTVREAVGNAGLAMSDIESIGVGTPGSVNKEKGMIDFANNLGFDKVPAYHLLNKRTGCKNIYFDNDANCAALGEAVAGAGKGVKNFIAVTLGTGVGSGIVVDGKLVTGVNYAGGEIGHTVIVFNGEQCSCGRRGCWERYASATALIQQTKDAMNADPYTSMWDNVEDGKIQNVNGRTAFDAMRAGDATAKKVVSTYMGYLACGLVNIINTFQPDILCIGGGIGNEKENLLAPVRKIVKAQTYSIHAEKQTVICPAELGNDAGIIGAALLTE